MNKKFPKSARLLRRSHFLSIFKQGRRFSGNVRIEYRRQLRDVSPKLGVTVSRQYGKAHDRNRFKRVVREAFRELRSAMPPGLELNVSPLKNGQELTMLGILDDLRALLEKINETLSVTTT